jgi:hypothetical protein
MGRLELRSNPSTLKLQRFSRRDADVATSTANTVKQSRVVVRRLGTVREIAGASFSGRPRSACDARYAHRFGDNPAAVDRGQSLSRSAVSDPQPMSGEGVRAFGSIAHLRKPTRRELGLADRGDLQVVGPNRRACRGLGNRSGFFTAMHSAKAL